MSKNDAAPIDDRNVGAGLVPARAPQGRHLNSLGFQPQVGSPSESEPCKSGRSRPDRPPLRGFDRFAPAYLGLKPQAIQMPPLRGAGGDKPRPYVSIAKSLFFVLLLLLPVLATASPPTKEQKAAIAALPDAYRAFLAEVEILLSDAERATFLALAKDYQRDAFIKEFWEVRDTVKRTARNEFHESWESNLQQAKLLFGDVNDGRTRALLLNGPPEERLESNCSEILYPVEVWFFDPSPRYRQPFALVFYRKWGAGPFRLWDPSEGIDVLFTGESGPLGQGHSLGEIASNSSTGCGTDEHARRMVAGIAWIQGNRDWNYVRALVDDPPKPPGGEWVSAFNSYSTDVPAGAAPLAAKLDLAFPGRWQSRTMTRGVVTVPPGAAGQARLGESRSYNLLLNGEVLSNGELFDSFRYKFDLPAPSADIAPEAIPLIFERPLRPGDYTLIVKLEDVNSGKVYREERPLSVPLMTAAAPVTSAPRTPEEAEAARRLAEADAALRSGDTTIKLVPPFGELRSGMQRFDTLTTGPGIEKVTFSLDGKPVLTKKSPPFSVELDLGGVPRTRTLAVAAYDAKGETLASDELQINATGNRFRVHLVEPQQGKRYESSLLARAEVEAPEGETVERVELYLNETRIATIYQPPYLHPVALPKGDSLNYVRAVAYLTDGNSTESLAFVNAPDVEHRQRRLRRALRHGARPQGAAGDHRVGRRILRPRLHGQRGRRPAADRPLRAGDRPAAPRRRGDRHLGLDGAPPGEGAGRRPAVPPGDGAPQGPRRGDHLQRPPGAGGQVHPRHHDAGRRARRPQGRARHGPL